MGTGRIALITPVLVLLLGHGLNNEAVLPQVCLGAAGLHRWGAPWLIRSSSAMER